MVLVEVKQSDPRMSKFGNIQVPLTVMMHSMIVEVNDLIHFIRKMSYLLLDANCDTHI
jgi:hypothetical protein